MEVKMASKLSHKGWEIKKLAHFSIEHMVDINKRQASFYDNIHDADASHGYGYDNNPSANVLTRIWSHLRCRHQYFLIKAGIEQKVKETNLQWAKSRPHSDIFELGCFTGGPLTFDFIELAKFYQGIDLSSKAVEALRKKIALKGLEEKAEVAVGDFLTMNSTRLFDIIYAHGVLHHFENPEIVFQKLHDLLKPDGALIFVEPSEYNLLYRLIRKMYRPFQSDTDWEWPFTENTIHCLYKYFTPIDGFGWGRWSLLLSVLGTLPILRYLIFKLYILLVSREIDQAFNNEVWYNPQLTALCVRRA